MASRKTDYKVYRGLAVFDRRFCVALNIDSSNSSYTQASPEPDQPVPGQGTYMRLEALGQLSSAAEIDVKTQRSGSPGDGQNGGRFVWKESTDGATSYRGWLNYNKVTGRTEVENENCDDQFDLLSIPTGEVILAYGRSVTSDVRVRVLSPSTEAWSNPTTVGDSAANSCPCMCRLPQGSTSSGGRILLFYVNSYTEAGTTIYRLDYAYSDDDGASWTVAGTQLDGFAVTWAPVSSSVVYDGKGTLHMVVEGTASGNGKHLISTNFGASWTEIETIAGLRKGWQLMVDEAGVVSAFYGIVSSSTLYFARKDNPATAFADSAIYDQSTLTDIDQRGASGNIPDLGVAMMPEGYAIVVTRDSTNTDEVRLNPYNISDGSSLLTRYWAASGDLAGVAGVTDTGDTSNRIDNCKIAAFKDRLIMVHKNISSTSSRDDYLMQLDCGGHSSVDWIAHTFGFRENSGGTQAGYLWLPFELPDNIALWTTNTLGTGSGTLDDDGVDISTTAGQHWYSRDGSTTVDLPVLARFRLTLPASGGALTSPIVGVIIDQRITGPAGYRVTLNFNNVGFRLYDVHAATALGADVTTMSTSTFYDILVCLENGEAATYWKTTTATLWNVGPSGTMTSGADPTNHSIEWGHPNAGTAATTWAYFGSCLDAEDEAIGIADFTNPNDLVGRAYDIRPLWVFNDLKLRARGSTSVVGDTWSVATRYGYGLTQADPLVSPSPAFTWRTTSTGAFNVDIQPASGTVTRLLRSSIVVAVLGTNIPSVTVSRVTSGTPTSLGTITGTTYLSSLDWTLSGNYVTLTATGSTDGRYIEEGDLVDATFTDGTNYSRITANSAGVVTSGMTMRVKLFLDDPSGFGASGSGTGSVRSRNLVGIIHNLTSDFDALRIAVASGTAAESYWEVGTIFIGPLHVFGRQYGRDRQETRVLNVDEYTDSRGTVRKDRRGPARRRYSMTWPPFITTAIHGADPSPNYLSANASSKDPFALDNDPFALEAIYHASEDGVLPVLYLPAIKGASSGSVEVVSLNLRREFCYATITSALQSALPLGDELETEVRTITGFTIEEIV